MTEQLALDMSKILDVVSEGELPTTLSEGIGAADTRLRPEVWEGPQLWSTHQDPTTVGPVTPHITLNVQASQEKQSGVLTGFDCSYWGGEVW